MKTIALNPFEGDRSDKAGGGVDRAPIGPQPMWDFGGVFQRIFPEGRRRALAAGPMLRQCGSPAAATASGAAGSRQSGNAHRPTAAKNVFSAENRQPETGLDEKTQRTF